MTHSNHKPCGSDEWRAVVRDSILPWALGTPTSATTSSRSARDMREPRQTFVAELVPRAATDRYKIRPTPMAQSWLPVPTAAVSAKF